MQDKHTSNEYGEAKLGGVNIQIQGIFFCCCCGYLVRLGIAESLLVHAEVAHLRHQFVWVDEEARAEQECEDVCPLWREEKILNHDDKLNIYVEKWVLKPHENKTQ